VKGTWQTDSGTSGPGIGLAVVVALVLLIAGSAGTVVSAAAHAAEVLLHLVLIAVASLAGVVVAGLGTWLVVRRRRASRPAPYWATVQPPAASVVPARTAAPPALPAPQIHLHLHGPVSAADVAELIAFHGNPQPAIEEETRP
jgi:hypothetical protein